MVGLLCTMCFCIGGRAYFTESESMDSVLLLQFAFSMLTLWRCLTIVPEVDCAGLNKVTDIRIHMQGIIPLVTSMLICLIHMAGLLISFTMSVKIDDANFIVRMLCLFISGEEECEPATLSRIIWCGIDFVLLLVIIIFKAKHKLTFSQSEFYQLRRTYKKLNLIFKVLAYAILGYESISNPLYIFIVYLALKQQINSTAKDSWTNTSNLIGLMRYVVITGLFIIGIRIPTLYFTIGKNFIDFFNAKSLDRLSFVNIIFFMVCHICVYTNELCKLLPKIQYNQQRSSYYPCVYEFDDSYFNQFLLGKWMRIMNPSHFALINNYYEKHISTLKSYFDRDPIIKDHIEKLKLKSEAHKYKWMQRLLIKVSYSNLDV